MSPSDAQRSPVHAATEDSTAEPTGPGPSSRQPSPPHPGTAPDTADLARQAADLKNRPDTALGVPSNFETGAAMARRVPDANTDANPPGAQDALPAGPGAGDASSAGGAGAGIPRGG